MELLTTETVPRSRGEGGREGERGRERGRERERERGREREGEREGGRERQASWERINSHTFLLIAVRKPCPQTYLATHNEQVGDA